MINIGATTRQPARYGTIELPHLGDLRSYLKTKDEWIKQGRNVEHERNMNIPIEWADFFFFIIKDIR